MVKVRKNRKKSWRKNVDISGVEEFMEDERLAERVGSNKSQPAFFIEKSGDSNNALALTESDAVVTRSGPRRTKDIVANLGCYKGLGQTSKVPAALKPRVGCPKKVNPPKEKKVTAKGRPARVKDTSGLRSGIYDIWDDEPAEKTGELADLEKQQKLLIGKNKIKFPVNLLQKPSLLSAIEVPHAGASYNPSFEDHQELLSKANAIEKKRQKDEKYITRNVTSFYRKTTNAEAAQNYMNEMTAGLGEESEDDPEMEIPSEGPKNPVVKAEDRKTKAQKKRDAELKEIKLKKMKLKEERSRGQQIFSVKNILRASREKNKKIEETIKKRQEKEIGQMYAARKMSRHKFEEEDMPLNLSSEITGTLRSVKTDGNLLVDRFKSFQKRNLIETRVLSLKKKKAKTVKITKKTHKEPIG
jgi:nucleolar protein 53